MIRLSKLTDYAVVILADMACTHDGPCMAASSLSARTSLPEPTVSKILKILSRAGLIQSVRGASGGYRMVRPASKVKMIDVIEVMEGPIALTACVDGGHDMCAIQSCCRLRGRWAPVNAAVRSALEAVSLADMMGVEAQATPVLFEAGCHVEH